MSRPTIAEIAALTARLRELSHAGRSADQADIDRFLADKRELLDRIQATADERELHVHGVVRPRDAARAPATAGPVDDAAVSDERDPLAGEFDELTERYPLPGDPGGDEWTLAPGGGAYLAEVPPMDVDHLGNGADPWADYRTYTPDQAAAALVARGIPPDQAPGIVDRYLDSLTWDRGWSPQDQWEIDDDDLDIMLTPAVGAEETATDEGSRDPERDASITSASWAIAARDAAIDRDDPTATDRFSAEAAEAIAAAERAGVDLAELAYELDYPGGVDAMLDGSSDTDEAGQEPPWPGLTDRALDEMHESVQDARSAGEFWQPAAAREQWRERDEAGEDGRRWELRDVTNEPADTADAYGSTYGTGYDWPAREFDPSADRGLTDAGPPIPSGPTLSAQDAAHALTADGWTPDEARAQVARYLNDVSAQLGAPAHAWGLDEADLDAIRTTDAGRTADAVQHAHEAVTCMEPTPESTAAVLVDEQPPAADVDVFE